jgi:hypothetical protein
MRHLLLSCAFLSATLAAGAAMPVSAQTTQAQVVVNCGTPNSAYSTGATRPVTQDTTGTLCTSTSAIGTVTVTNPFALEATQLLNKADLDSLVAAASNPAAIFGTNGTTIAASGNPFDVGVRTVAGTAVATGNGVTGGGSQRVTIASDNTAFGVIPQAGTTGGATTYHVIAAASTNAANIKNSAGTVYSVTGTSIHTTYQYLRLYNTSGSPTCSSATGLVGGWIIPGATTGAGGTFQIPVGVAFSSGIGICITGGFSDTDTTNATASVLSVNVNYN